MDVYVCVCVRCLCVCVYVSKCISTFKILHEAPRVVKIILGVLEASLKTSVIKFYVTL